MIPHEQFLKFKNYVKSEKQNSYKSNTAEQESEQSDNDVTCPRLRLEAMRVYICHHHQECLRVV